MTVKADIELCPISLKTALRDTYKVQHKQMDSGEFGAHFLEDLEKSFNAGELLNLRSLYVGKYRTYLNCSNCKKKQVS
jgi:hypothetical protein